MATILIVYASDHGGTKKAAEAVAAGVATVSGATAVLREAEKATLDDLKAADGLILGSPTHMGSGDWRVKKFIDSVTSTAWMQGIFTGRVGGVFGTGGGYGNSGGGTELVMLGLLSDLAELGALIVPLPNSTPGYAKAGLQWGPWGRTHSEDGKPAGLSDDKLEVFRHHGANVARAAILIKGSKVFAK
jgi:NAD(P)H dehydrogenase (quinone)